MTSGLPRGLVSRRAETTVCKPTVTPKAPLAEGITQRLEPSRDQITTVEDIRNSIALTETTIRWSPDAKTAHIFDDERYCLAVIQWEGDGHKVTRIPTPALLREGNERLPFSCAIGNQKPGSDGSMTAKLAHARAEVAGQMSTN